MRPRSSIAGPLILIVIGVLFLLHTISPNFDFSGFVGHYWPYLLILWGVVQLVEICIREAVGGVVPVNGISGGSWFLIIVICFFGLAMFQVHKAGTWWRQAGFSRGVEMFGDEHDYPVASQAQTAGKAPHIVIENFRGGAKITGADTTQVSLSGQKVVRAFDENEAGRSDQATPVEMSINGNTVTIRCNQDRAGSRTRVSDDLELSVPHGSSIEISGIYGDFDISSITGDVNITSDNAGVRLDDIGGNVRVETGHSDIVRCTNVQGRVDIRGHGEDLELTKIASPVTVDGDYSGTLSLRELAKPVKLTNSHTQFEAEGIPGEIRLDRGALDAENVVGPFKVTARSTDVTLSGFSNSLELVVDKGDVDLKPGREALSRMVVHTRSGNIELTLPPAANFDLNASTDSGDIDNEFGDELKEHSEGHGSRLQGAVGAGPGLVIVTERGSITVRKSSETGSPASDSTASL